MKKYVFPAVLATVVLIIVLAVCFFNLNNKFQYSKLELASEEIIPSSIKLFNASGKANKINDVKSKYKVVFYLDSTNEDCMKRLDGISKMIDLISFEDMSYVLVWEDQIPLKQIKEAGIAESYNYTLAGKATLSESKPTAFLTDENNKIIMVTGYSYISLINEVIEIGKKDLSAKAGEMILKNALKSETFLQENNGKTLLMFMSSSCRLCRENEDIIRKNIDSLRKKINVITVRPDFDTKQDFDEFFEIDPEQIYFNMFAYSQRVEASNRKYPMFYIINSDYSVEKLITDPNELVKYISGL
jgi:hypothetical protein